MQPEGKRISQLTPDTSPSTDDFIVTVDGTTLQNKKVDLGSLPVSNPTNALFDTKVDKAPGKQLSDQNYTQDEKNKLAGIEAGAEVNEVTTAQLNGKVSGTGRLFIQSTAPTSPLEGDLWVDLS